MVVQPRRSAPKKKQPAIAPRYFFERSAPRLLTALRTTCSELGGVYVVEVPPEGAWTLDFPAATVRAGADPNADLHVTLTPEQFQQVATARIELAKLVRDGSAPSVGAQARVENLSFVLAFLERK